MRTWHRSLRRWSFGLYGKRATDSFIRRVLIWYITPYRDGVWVLNFSEIFRIFVQQNNKGDTNLLMDRNSWKSSSSARIFFHPIESVN